MDKDAWLDEKWPWDPDVRWRGDHVPTTPPVEDGMIPHRLKLRTLNGLMNANFRTWREVLAKDAAFLLRIKNFGPISLNNLECVLASAGWSLRTPPPEEIKLRRRDLEHLFEIARREPRRNSVAALMRKADGLSHRDGLRCLGALDGR